MVPCEVIINADSLSCTLLLISLPCLPIFGPFSGHHLSMRSAFLRSLSICLSLSAPPDDLLPVFSSPSPRSTSTCSSTNCFTFFSIFSFFHLKSFTVPLHSLEAFEGSLQPSTTKNAHPRRPYSSTTILKSLIMVLS